MEIKIKKIWFIVLTLIVLGLIFYFLSQKSENQQEQSDGRINKDEIKKEYKNPISKIVLPSAGSSYSKDFLVKIWDADAGGSGIDANQCSYSIYNCLDDSCRLSFSNEKRVCNKDFLIKVGQAGDCSVEGLNACRIIVKSKDLAGNNNIISDTEESIRDFTIDWTPPKAEIIALTPIISAQVSDNVEISDCDLIVDGQSQNKLKKQLNFSETPCPLGAIGKCHEASLKLSLASDKNHELRVDCWDSAGNMGYSEPVRINIPVNHQPEIYFCRVLPTQGSFQDEFHFETEASDPDGNELSYAWEFGDGTIANEKNPTHRYSQKGVFEPQVTVSDGIKETKCSTAWVGIIEE